MHTAWMPRDVRCTVKQALRIRPTSYGLVGGERAGMCGTEDYPSSWNGFEIDPSQICCINSVTLLIRKSVAV